jgi:pyruvate/oxaloacetate carboxyltransferase
VALILVKILIIVAAVGLLRSSPGIQSMSRDIDERAFAALRRIMRVTEDYGYPPLLVPLLMLLTALSFMLSMYVTAPFGR